MSAALAQVAPPTPPQVVVAVAAVVAGALVATISAYAAIAARNWLYHLGSVGGLLVVAGVVGQRIPVDGAPMGPWDAGITIPVAGVRLDPVTAAGVIVCLVGVVIALLVERVPEPAVAGAPRTERRFEDDDTV